MTTKFRQKYAKIAHILVPYTIWRHFLCVDRVCGIGMWQVQICYPNFSGSKWRCHGNQICAKI